jgi:hypothetical protein
VFGSAVVNLKIAINLVIIILKTTRDTRVFNIISVSKVEFLHTKIIMPQRLIMAALSVATCVTIYISDAEMGLPTLPEIKPTWFLAVPLIPKRTILGVVNASSRTPIAVPAITARAYRRTLKFAVARATNTLTSFIVHRQMS